MTRPRPLRRRLERALWRLPCAAIDALWRLQQALAAPPPHRPQPQPRTADEINTRGRT